jgi:hypothetical protein
MAAYRKKPVIVDASIWITHGDHPQVEKFSLNGEASAPCGQCGAAMHDHGIIPTLEGNHIVCPGDWIITGVKGEHYPCKPDIFKATYEPVEQ